MTVDRHDEIAYPLRKKIMGIKNVRDVIPAGSRRRCDGSKNYTIGDIDLVVVTEDENIDRNQEIARKVAGMLEDLTMNGNSKVSGNYKGVQVDVRFCGQNRVGGMLMHCTGSKYFNIKMRAKAKAKGYTLNEYGLHVGFNVIADTEEAIFQTLGMEYIEPRNR